MRDRLTGSARGFCLFGGYSHPRTGRPTGSGTFSALDRPLFEISAWNDAAITQSAGWSSRLSKRVECAGFFVQRGDFDRFVAGKTHLSREMPARGERARNPV